MSPRSRLVACVLLAAAVAGCGGGASSKTPSTPARATPAAVPRPSAVALVLGAFPRRVSTATLTLRGSVTPGATLTVAGKPVRVANGQFRTVVQLAAGRNRIRITARKPGLRLAHKVVVVKSTAASGTASPGTPYRDQNGNPAPNPNCPAGTAPTRSGGGCVPYNENNPPPEPKINNPACYKPNPPPGCF